MSVYPDINYELVLLFQVQNAKRVDEGCYASQDTLRFPFERRKII